ncbi:MAG: hypothetical protein DI539_07010 [Flavobacterium psychrophilum]|nr:MAG: hypothetical protein DI539_07010 [Flavobacterium psychrophilum]
MEKIYEANPISFYNRFLKRLFLYLAISLFLCYVIFNIQNLNITYKIAFSLLLIPLALFTAYKLSKHHYNKIYINNKTITFQGYHINQFMESTENLKEVEIIQRVKASKNGHIAYFLVFKTKKKNYYINEYYNWDDEYVITLFEDFKNAKQEKITLDEKITFKLTKY